MKRKKYIIVVLFVFWSLVIGVLALLTRRDDGQQRLNYQLLEAVKHDNTPKALHALELGADSNVRDEPYIPAWLRIWDLFQQHRSMPSVAPTPLLMSLRCRENDNGTLFLPKENLKLVTTLLAHGAATDVSDERGHTPLWYALYGRQTATVRMLLNCGPSLTPGPNADSLLKVAVEERNEPVIVEAILKYGANPDYMGPRQGRSLLCTALFNENIAMARMLIEHNANVTIHQEHLSLLYAIGHCKDAGIVELLLRHGANPRHAENGGITPLGMAMLCHDADSVQSLLRHHADPNATSTWLPSWKSHTRPLEYAEKNHMTKIAKMLRDAGAK